MKTVDLWVICPAEVEGDLCLTNEEMSRMNSIREETRRVFHGRSRSLTRRVLARKLGIAPREVTIHRTAAGKPWLGNRPGLGFSLSHSGEWLTIAVGEGAVGVDVESRLPCSDVLPLAKRFFSPPDYSALLGTMESGQKERFRHQWVAKEAAIKAAGTGLANVLAEAECGYRDGLIEAVRWGDARFAITHFETRDGAPGAVAVPGGAPAEIVMMDVANLNVS